MWHWWSLAGLGMRSVHRCAPTLPVWARLLLLAMPSFGKHWASFSPSGSLLQLFVAAEMWWWIAQGFLSYGFSARWGAVTPWSPWACPLPSLPCPLCGVLWLLHHGSSQDFFIFSCELLHFSPLLSVLRAAVLSTNPNYSFSDFLEVVTFLIIFRD